MRGTVAPREITTISWIDPCVFNVAIWYEVTLQPENSIALSLEYNLRVNSQRCLLTNPTSDEGQC